VSSKLWEVHAAIYAEAEDPSWAVKLTKEEAKLAARYAPIEIGRLPHWMADLVNAHPESVDEILGTELSWELQNSNEHINSMLLQNISYAPNSTVAGIFLPRLQAWLKKYEDIMGEASNPDRAVNRLRQVLDVILKHGDENIRTNLLTFAHQRIRGDISKELMFVWLPILIQNTPELGVPAFEDQIRMIQPSKDSDAVQYFGAIFGGRRDGINLRDSAFTPKLLLQLLRLAYQHVRPVDDAEHEGSYSPDIRDQAERVRNEIVNSLFALKGNEGWKAKLEMANDPLCMHFKDRILAIAEENWAQEVDSISYDDAQTIALEKTGEAPAFTNEAMFAIMNDRMADLHDLLLQDTSPRDAWAGITDEKVMRREIARELKHAANGIYKVDQEAATADEKETDIRLRSVVSDHEAVIELKLGHRSARDLRDTIYNQLVKKYMAAEYSRSGCLLITLAKEKQWEHPDTGQLIGLVELEALLCEEAKRVENVMGGSVALAVHILDLRPRLPKEKINFAGISQ
jgi:hypothetical protein